MYLLVNFIDQTFHIVGHIRACVSWRFTDASVGVRVAQLITTDVKLCKVNGPNKQAIRLLRKWEKDLKFKGWIQKSVTDKKTYSKNCWCEI